ncbi:hypothetical protein EYC80_010322 [Monilinia laxa]|uniref:amidase n=1 Tax=Monilinia laxa TaxID=61186 RepID=A0A5N6JND9_MONLA|nr:hypothetical protein EYC80_010322 [Monilinia laxa]
MAPFIAEESKGIPDTTPETKDPTELNTTTTDPSTTTHSPPSWQTTASHRRQQINSSIPPEWLLEPHHLTSKHPVDLVKTCGLLTEREIHIIYSTALELLEKMKSRKYTAVEVTRAFCKASAVAHQATNCLAWTMYPSALSRAAELDAHMAKTGEPIGPLHGLPISVKEHIYLLSTPSTSGFVGWADNFCTDAEKEGICIQILRETGAIFHVKTTNPQGLMALETESNLYGRTTNPLNTSLSPGGSSGGESALIAMRGSVLGIGTDIGGSIRSPALSCGLYALKPSVARLPHSGLSGAHAGMESIIGVVGPLGRSLADIELFCKVLIDREPWKREVSLIPIPWRCRDPPSISPSPSPRKLKIGIIYTDGVHDPHPPIARALHHITRTLHTANHTTIPFPTSLHPALATLTSSLYLLDAGAEYHAHLALSSEPATPLLKWLFDHETTQTRTMAQQWALHAERNRLQDAYARMMGELGVDCLIAPGGVGVACAHGEARYWGYTSVFNGLDLPVFCLPVGELGVGGLGGGDEGDGEGDGVGTVGKVDRGIEENKREKTEVEAQWDSQTGPEKYKGGIVGIQIIGRRLEEEKLLDMVRIIERDLGLGERK